MLGGYRRAIELLGWWCESYPQGPCCPDPAQMRFGGLLQYRERIPSTDRWAALWCFLIAACFGRIIDQKAQRGDPRGLCSWGVVLALGRGDVWG